MGFYDDQVGTTAGGTTVAMGLGDGLDAIREHLERTNYSTFLVSWARQGSAVDIRFSFFFQIFFFFFFPFRFVSCVCPAFHSIPVRKSFMAAGFMVGMTGEGNASSTIIFVVM